MERVFPSGLGGSTGDLVATRTPFYIMGGVVWYVDSQTGADSGNIGKDRRSAYATLSKAYTSASAGDVIVLLDGHTETLTSAQALGKDGLTLVGEGSSSGVPTVSFTRNVTGSLFTVSADYVRIFNLKFPAGSAAASAAGDVLVTGAGFSMRGCYFQGGANDNGGTKLFLSTGADHATVENTTFISTSTTTTPGAGMTVNGTALTNLRMSGVTFDGGTIGFTNGWGFDNSGAAMTNFMIEDLSLLRGADMYFKSTSTGYVAGVTSTSDGRIDCTG